MIKSDKRQPGLQAGLSFIVSGLEIFSSIVILIMMILTFVDVLGRYIFAAPIFGASEMIAALLAIAIFSGLGITNARDEHIVVELVDHRIRKLAPRVYETVIQLFSVAAMLLIVYVITNNALEAYHRNSVTFVLELPNAYIYGLVALLALLSIVSQILGLILRWTVEADPT